VTTFFRLSFSTAGDSNSRMQFGICNEIFQGWSLDDTFAYAKKAGYDQVEIAPFTIAKSVAEISAAQRQEIRESAARAGVGISGLHWVLVQAEGKYLTHPDAAIRADTAEYFLSTAARISAGHESSSARRSSAM
jgi:sugar phosphate isomerase/epimerase